MVALRYVGRDRFDPSEAPAWVKAVYDVYCIIHEISTKISYISSTDLGKIKKAAIASGHPEFGPRGGHIKASFIAEKARNICLDLEKKQFSAYRQSHKDELSELGTVTTGMCSCLEFITN